MTQEISVSFKVEVPVEATDSEIREWLKFQLGESGCCSSDNPLVGFELNGSDVWFEN